MAELVSPFFDLRMRIEDAVHGAYGAVVYPFIQKGCVDFMGCLVHELVGMEDVEHFLPFLGGKRPMMPPAFVRYRIQCLFLLPLAVKRRTGDAQGFAGRPDPYFRGKREGGFHQSFSPSSGVESGIPNI